MSTYNSLQVSYVIFEVPANMLLTRARPSFFLSGICILWGGVAACMAAGKTWSQIAAVRFCLGVVEAAFAPGVAYYLSCWYKTHELARRFALYYTGMCFYPNPRNYLMKLTHLKSFSHRGFGCFLWLARRGHHPVP